METGAASDKLLLADWRRRVNELYAEVRRVAASDPRAAWDLWRDTRERLYREHASSPVPAEARPGFAARYFEYDPGLRFELPVVADPTGVVADTADTAAAADAASAAATPATTGPVRPAWALPISIGPAISFERVGWLDIPFDSGAARLALFWLPEYSGGFFLPFRDQTNGAETYGGGRYLLDTAKGADLGGDGPRGIVVADFNFAFHPSCAFDPRWSCPLSPPENRLSIPVRGGERVR